MITSRNRAFVSIAGAMLANLALLLATAQSTTVEVRGIVLDAGTRRPIARTVIRIGSRSATSDEEGRFTITDLLAGRQLVSASRAGYMFGGLRDPKTVEHQVYRETGMYVSIPPETRFQTTVYMLPVAAVSGTLLNAKGEPAEGAIVVAFRFVYDIGGTRILARAPGGGVTDDRGEFQMSLPPGEYIFRADDNPLRSRFAPTYYPSSTESSKADTTKVDAVAGTRLRPLLLRSVPSATLWVRLVDESGKEPADFGSVWVRRSEDTNAPPVLSIGRYVKLAEGVYDVEALTLSMPDPLTAPVLSSVRSGRASVEIRDKDVETTITVKSGSRLTGRIVKKERTGELTPVSGAQAWLFPTSSSPLSTSPFKTTSSTDGIFGFASVPSGAYRVRIPLPTDDIGRDYVSEADLRTAPRGVCVNQIFQDNQPVAGDQLKVGSVDTTVTILLEESGTSISGNAVDSNGTPAEGAVIVLISDNPAIPNYSETTADQNGAFQLRCVARGAYRLYAWSELPGAAYRNEEFMSKYRQRGMQVRITDDRSLTIQAAILD